jgi:hypothetical protein
VNPLSDDEINLMQSSFSNVIRNLKITRDRLFVRKLAHLIGELYPKMTNENWQEYADLCYLSRPMRGEPKRNIFPGNNNPINN